MRNRYLILLLCLIAPLIFFIWFVYYPYTLWAKEATSFFIWTPDYIHLTMSGNGGIPALIGNFLLQFYRWPLIGATFQAVFPTLILLAVMHVIYRLPISKDWYIIALLPALVVAWYQFTENQLIISVRWVLIFIMIAIIIEILFRVFKKETVIQPQNGLAKRIVLSAVSLILMACFYVKAVSNAEYKLTERTNRLDYYAYTSRWNDILNLIGNNTNATGRDLCYITLALNQQGKLGDYIFHYPVNSEEYFLNLGVASEQGTFFNQLFYSNIGLYNQAIHQAFQEATKTKNGMSFRVIMNLIKYNIAIGNEQMANKYMDILSHASCYAEWIVKRRIELAASLKSERKEDPQTVYMTNTTLRNLYSFVQAGNENVALNNYYLCALLIHKNMLAFTAHLNTHKYLLKDGIPIHYMEALVLAATQGYTVEGVSIPDSYIQRFNEFQSLIKTRNQPAIAAKYKFTYWYNYYFMTFPDDPNIESEAHVN